MKKPGDIFVPQKVTQSSISGLVRPGPVLFRNLAAGELPSESRAVVAMFPYQLHKKDNYVYTGYTAVWRLFTRDEDGTDGSNAAEQAGAAGATRTEEDTYLDTMTAKLDSKSMTEATFYMGPIQVTLSLVTDDEEAPAGGGKQRSVPPAKRSLSRASTVASLSSVKTAQEDTRPEAAGAAADESATSTDAWNCETHSTQNTAHVSVLDAADYQKPSESLGTTTASSSYWSSSDGVLVSEVGYSFLAIDGNNIPQFECVSGAWDGGKGELATSCYGLRMVARMAQYAAAAIGIGFSLTVDEDKLQFNVSGVNWANIDSYLKLARRFITIDGDEPLEVFLKYGYPSKKQKGKRIERTVRVAMLIGSVGK
eukprot:g1616.t1